MNVLHVTPAFYPATYWGGPIYSTFGLCNSLALFEQVDLKVLTTDSAGLKTSDRVKVSDTDTSPARMPAGYDVFYCRGRLTGTFSPDMLRHLKPMVGWADVVHLTGVYSPPTLPTLFAAGQLGKPVVWSPRGALQRWAGSTRRSVKNIWDKACDALCDRGRVTLHFTTRKEQLESAGRIKRAGSAVIANGVEMPETPAPRTRRAGEEFRLLYLGRLHPIKGIENLMRAIAESEPTVTLSVCGEGRPAYRDELVSLAERLAVAHRVRFLGRVEGEAKSARLREADVCVVPSYSENFGMVVVEALAHGVPVIASTGTPWSELESRGCGFWVGNSPPELALAISEARECNLREMGERAERWMREEFSWKTVARRMKSLYESLSTNGR